MKWFVYRMQSNESCHFPCHLAQWHQMFDIFPAWCCSFVGICLTYWEGWALSNGEKTTNFKKQRVTCVLCSTNHSYSITFFSLEVDYIYAALTILFLQICFFRDWLFVCSTNHFIPSDVKHLHNIFFTGGHDINGQEMPFITEQYY